MITLFIFCFKAAIIAFVYSEILVMGGEILNGWYKFTERILGKYPMIFKPLVDCHKCVAGQIALWGYLAAHCELKVYPDPIFYFQNYSLMDHAASICLAILMSITIKSLYKKFIEQ